MTIRPLVLVCIVVFAVAMLGVRFAAHGIVDNFGTTGGLVVLALMFAAAWMNDQRERP
jgi:hypothetical protein